MPENAGQRRRRTDDPERNATGAVDQPTAETGTIGQDEISRRAYERFQARGAEHGRDQEDWFEAEREALGRRRE